MPRHIRRGDTVVITSGDHKGKSGEVMRIDADRDRVFIKGVNLRTKHVKRTQTNPQGAIITKEGPVHISNVSLLEDGKPTRVRFEVRDSGKVRVSARSGKVLPVPVWDKDKNSYRMVETL